MAVQNQYSEKRLVTRLDICHGIGYPELNLALTP